MVQDLHDGVVFIGQSGVEEGEEAVGAAGQEGGKAGSRGDGGEEGEGGDGVGVGVGVGVEGGCGVSGVPLERETRLVGGYGWEGMCTVIGWVRRIDLPYIDVGFVAADFYFCTRGDGVLGRVTCESG